MENKASIFLLLILILVGLISFACLIPGREDYFVRQDEPIPTLIQIHYMSTSNTILTCNETFSLSPTKSHIFPTIPNPQCAQVICILNSNMTITTQINFDAIIPETTSIFIHLDTQTCDCSKVHYLIREGKTNYNIWGSCCISC